MMTARQITRAAYRRADERMAELTAYQFVQDMARFRGCTWVEIPGARREYRRAEARRALAAAGYCEVKR